MTSKVSLRDVLVRAELEQFLEPLNRKGVTRVEQLDELQDDDFYRMGMSQYEKATLMNHGVRTRKSRGRLAGIVLKKVIPGLSRKSHAPQPVGISRHCYCPS